MLELSLLGLHALRGPDGRELTALPAQPKRFALLAYLALGGPGYHRRDTIAAMFWPELDQFAARRALRNTLYHLREALGDGVIITRGDDAVSVNPAMLTCDVTLMSEALGSGRYEEAVDRYRGELLAGIHFAGAGEMFEEWLSVERARVVELAMAAFREIVAREEALGHHVVAAHWAQRACALAPSDEALLRRAMVLYQQGSDPGSALHLHEVHARRLAAEFKTRPGAETVALASRIRAGSGVAAVAPAELRVAPESAASVIPEPTTQPVATVLEPAVAVATPSLASPRPRGRARWAWSAIGLAAVTLVAIMLLRGRHSPAVATRARVLVAVFDNRTGDSVLQSLGRMTQDWIIQGLLRTQLVDVVDSRSVFVQSRIATAGAVDLATLAKRTGARLAVSGGYYRSGDTLLVQAAVMDVPSGRIVRVVGPIFTNIRTPLAALDELRSRVMTALATTVDVHGTQDLGNADVPPFEAYQAYVEGWDAYWHGDGRRAQSFFLQAAQRDSAFTAADLAAAGAAANSNNCPLVDSLSGVLAHRQLDRSDRLSVRIADARCRGRNEEMMRLTLERADLEPGNSASQMSAANAALWANRPARALELFARVDPAVDLAWSSDTTHFVYWSGTAEALHLLGRHRDELAMVDHLPSGAPLTRVWLRGSALAALSRPSAVLALLDSALSLPVETASDMGLAPYTEGRPQFTVTPGWVANWVSRELAVHGDSIASRQAAMRALAWYRGRPLAERSTPEERLVAAWSLEMIGSFAEAARMARQLVEDDSTNVDFRGELAGLAAEQGDTALADSLDRWLAAQPVARVSWTASIYRARSAALLGRNDDAVARLREAFDEGLWPRWLHVEPALARLQRRADYVALVTPRD